MAAHAQSQCSLPFPTFSAPFTLQRLCEVLGHPHQQFTFTHKLLNALDKLLCVTATIAPSVAGAAIASDDTSQLSSEEGLMTSVEDSGTQSATVVASCRRRRRRPETPELRDDELWCIPSQPHGTRHGDDEQPMDSWETNQSSGGVWGSLRYARDDEDAPPSESTEARASDLGEDASLSPPPRQPEADVPSPTHSRKLIAEILASAPVQPSFLHAESDGEDRGSSSTGGVYGDSWTAAVDDNLWASEPPDGVPLAPLLPGSVESSIQRTSFEVSSMFPSARATTGNAATAREDNAFWIGGQVEGPQIATAGAARLVDASAAATIAVPRYRIRDDSGVVADDEQQSTSNSPNSAHVKRARIDVSGDDHPDRGATRALVDFSDSSDSSCGSSSSSDDDLEDSAMVREADRRSEEDAVAGPRREGVLPIAGYYAGVAAALAALRPSAESFRTR